MNIKSLWPFIGFFVALGFQASGITNVYLAYSLWFLAVLFLVAGYGPKIKALLFRHEIVPPKAESVVLPQLEIVCPGGVPYWDELPGYQIRRVGVVNNSRTEDLMDVNVWLEDIVNDWDHNLGAVRLREKGDIPPSSDHVYRSGARITPGDMKYFDVLEKHTTTSELLLCYADNVSPNWLPPPARHYIITLKVTAANQLLRHRKFFLRIREGDKIDFETFGNSY